MKKLITFLAVIFLANTSFSQEIKKESLFEGVLNEKPIQIYIQSFMQDCTGATYYKSIVRFFDPQNKETVWRKFMVFANDNNGFLLVDDYWNSGRYNNYIFIEQNGFNLKGHIIDSKKIQKNIQLQKNISMTDFSELRKQVQQFEDTDDC